MSDFGNRIRERREELLQGGGRVYSQRQVALRVGMEPSYLSKIERGLFAPPSEEKILLLARELGLDSDTLLALAGKVAEDLQEIIRERPPQFGRLIRGLKDAPEEGLLLLTERAENRDW